MAGVKTAIVESKWRVWVLEDSATEARLAAIALDSSCKLTFFTEGAALLEHLASGEEPELLILDYVLPDMSGLEVCRFVRRAQDRVSLPILMLTGSGDEQTLLDCFRAGANDFVNKPFRPAELSARVENLSQMSRAALASRMSEREQAEVALATAHDATREAHAHISQKDRYIGILGHDLRNPLSAIITAAKLMEMKPESASRNAPRIQRSAQRMVVMIRDILDFARGKLTQGIPIVVSLTSLGQICADVANELTVSNPGREIQLDISNEVEGVWDADRLQQAISNLVGNAIEHSEGLVTLRVAATEEDVVITVHNHGAAILVEDLPTLFEPFRKRDASSGGLGLGLFIVKEIAKAHGGAATVQSTAEEGTTFRMTFPRTAAPRPPLPG